MGYPIELARRAEQDIDDVFEHISVDAPQAAVRWREDLQEKLSLISAMPASFPLAIENRQAPCEVRHFLFGKYRILYTIQSDRVMILTIRHGARLPISASELRRITRQ